MRWKIAALTGSILAIAVLVWQWRSRDSSTSAPELATDDGRQRVHDFWGAYNEASHARTQGDFRGAALIYQQALDIDPNHEECLFYLALCRQEIGEYAGAEEVLRRMIEINPSSGRAISQLAALLSTPLPGARIDYDEAARLLQRNLEVNPEQAGPFLRLGWLELNRGRPAEAVRHFRVAGGFGSPEGHFWAGYSYWVQGQPGAAPHFQNVLETQRREARLAGKGVRSEGDVLPDPDKPLSAMDRAAIKASLFSRWPSPAHRWRGATPNLTRLPNASEALWIDFDDNGEHDLVVGGDYLRIFRSQRGELRETRAGVPAIRGVAALAAGQAELYISRSNGASLILRHTETHGFERLAGAAVLERPRLTLRVLAVDIDSDGRGEFLEVGAASEDLPSVRLYRNVNGEWTEQARQLGLRIDSTVVDAAAADLDADGHPELILLPWRQPPRVFSMRAGRFEDITAQTGLPAQTVPSRALVLFDFDRDSRPDLLLAPLASIDEVLRDLLQPGSSPARSHPMLFRNAGQERFEQVTNIDGLNRASATMRVVAADLDADGWPDLVFANGDDGALRVEPGFALRNRNGRAFEPFPIPALEQPDNLLGAAATSTHLYMWRKTEGILLRLRQ